MESYAAESWNDSGVEGSDSDSYSGSEKPASCQSLLPIDSMTSEQHENSTRTYGNICKVKTTQKTEATEAVAAAAAALSQ